MLVAASISNPIFRSSPPFRQRSMGSVSDQIPQISNTDLSYLDPSHPGGERWEAARAAVADALISHGCFEAIYPAISHDIRGALFDLAMPELFALPLETKLRNVSDEPYQGYVGQIPSMAFESLRVGDATSVDAVEEFTRIMWPRGNSNFCKAVIGFARPMQQLVQIVHRMILESFGVENHYDAHMSSILFGLRLSEYGVPLDQNTNVAMGSHVDTNLVTLVCQHRIQGLQIETLEGDWINVVPSPNSVTVIIGQSFQAWTNGKLRAPNHRVKMMEAKMRYSALYGSRPSYDAMIETPKELVDEKHPLLYKPYSYREYVKFRFSEEGIKHKDAFTAFCGIGQEALNI